MWPWEHLTFGYLLYSGYTRFVHRRRPTDDEAVVLATGTQFPDLVDKPLAWAFGILPSGLSLAHSVLFFVPLCVFLALLGRRYPTGGAFCLGYGSHLMGDLLYPLATGGRLNPAFLLWPLVSRTPSDTRGLFGNLMYYTDQFVVFLGTPRGYLYLFVEITLLILATVVWADDGIPGSYSLGDRLRFPKR